SPCNRRPGYFMEKTAARKVERTRSTRIATLLTSFGKDTVPGGTAAGFSDALQGRAARESCYDRVYVPASPVFAVGLVALGVRSGSGRKTDSRETTPG